MLAALASSLSNVAKATPYPRLRWRRTIKDLSFELVVRTAPQAEPLSNKKWGWRNVASPGVFPPRRFIV
jgi:hypothetical protein